MPKPSKFWDVMARRYAKSPVSDEKSYQQKLEITRGYLTPDMKVMEFGCGTGSTAISHAPFVKSILATDFSEKMLDIARDKAREAGVENVTFKQSGIDEFDAPNQSYDVIMGHSILHLLPDKERVIAKVFQLLKPGGVFISSTSCINNARILKIVLPLGHAIGLMPLVRFFSADELLKNFTDAGFEIEYNWRPKASDAVFIVAKRPA